LTSKRLRRLCNSLSLTTLAWVRLLGRVPKPLRGMRLALSGVVRVMSTGRVWALTLDAQGLGQAIGPACRHGKW
jgi:hypothetical protein